MEGEVQQNKGLRSKEWPNSYRTSSTRHNHFVDILHDFYIPVLTRSNRYDRVAGYFTSHSLAAASQGFSAFVGKEGKIRLIVGADLPPDDVKAILEGDQERLTQGLNSKLDEPGSWPEEEQNGVALLAWMVANNHLEVKVGFRLHQKSGKPIPFNSREDGYVHEKWALFYDKYGNALYTAGSLNESKNALIRNAENIDIHCSWWDPRTRERIAEAEDDFRYLWSNDNPAIKVMSIPEAVRERLIHISKAVERPKEIDGTSAVPKEVEPPSAYERLRFAMTQDGPHLPGGQYVGMETAPVEPWPHQSIVARKLIDTWPYSHLLCDEVGLGKTIEAGLALRSLYLSGLINKVLIAPPASLKHQWQREMASKFLLPFALTETSPDIKHEYIFPLQNSRYSDSIFQPDLNIISSALFRREDRLRNFTTEEVFDVVLIDEAHAARRQNPNEGTRGAEEYGNLYKYLERNFRPNTQSLWLATATPMQLNRIEAWDLIKLTNRIGPFQYDPTLTFQYYDILKKLIIGEKLHTSEWEFLRKIFNNLKQVDPHYWNNLEDVVLDEKIANGFHRWLASGTVPPEPDHPDLRPMIFLASPLSRVMFRHNRELLKIYKQKGKLKQNLAERIIRPIEPIKLEGKEKEAYDAFSAYCEQLTMKIGENSEGPSNLSIGFYKSFLRLRFASSYRAISNTVRNRIRRVTETLQYHIEFSEIDESAWESLISDPEDEEGKEAEEAILKNRSVADLRWELDALQGLSMVLGQVPQPSKKLLRLLGEIDDRRVRGTNNIRQTVIFSRFYDTVEETVEVLRQRMPNIHIGVYSGKKCQYTNLRDFSLIDTDREEVKHRFLQGKIDVLVCTDAAAEGLNLQTADLIINYDLPWNPMKVEQRIGRLDRIGQTHGKVYVLNLCYLNSAEEIVYHRLLERLKDAGFTVGTQQVSMLPVESHEFRDLAEGQLDPGELEQRAKDRLEAQQEQIQSMEIRPSDLFDIYMEEEEKRARQELSVSLESIWEVLINSDYLANLGCQVHSYQGKEYLELKNIPGFSKPVLITASRQLYEEGLPEENIHLEFAAYGGKSFDRLVNHILEFDLPGCIRKIDASGVGNRGNWVGYAIAIKKGESTNIQLVTSLDDIEEITLDEKRTVTDAEVKALQGQLEAEIREKYNDFGVTKRLERDNKKAGLAQRILSDMIAHQILYDNISSVESERFSRVIDVIESRVSDKSEKTIRDLDRTNLKTVENYLIFTPQIPSVGDKGRINAPHSLLISSVDKLYRTAARMKEGRTKLQIGTVLSGLTRDINKELDQFRKL